MWLIAPSVISTIITGDFGVPHSPSGRSGSEHGSELGSHTSADDKQPDRFWYHCYHHRHRCRHHHHHHHHFSRWYQSSLIIFFLIQNHNCHFHHCHHPDICHHNHHLHHHFDCSFIIMMPSCLSGSHQLQPGLTKYLGIWFHFKPSHHFTISPPSMHLHHCIVGRESYLQFMPFIVFSMLI